MRVSAEIIREEGIRVTSHSKFYIWEDKLFEPSLYRGKPTKSYKPVTNFDRIRRVMAWHNESKEIPTISLVCPSVKSPVNNSSFKHDRYAILDL